MIRSFRHSGLEKFYNTGSKAGIRPAHATKLGLILDSLNAATTIGAMNVAAFRLHPLKGTLAGHWSVWVNGNYRVTFRFENGDAEVVDYHDYHS